MKGKGKRKKEKNKGKVIEKKNLSKQKPAF